MRVLAFSAALGLVGAGLTAGPAPVARAELAGKVIVLDAGHGASVDGPLTRQVPNGRGATKDCQTTGTSTVAGFPEHTFTWDVASLIRDQLDQLGATVVMTRSDDAGPAPCVFATTLPPCPVHLRPTWTRDPRARWRRRCTVRWPRPPRARPLA